MGKVWGGLCRFTQRMKSRKIRIEFAKELKKDNLSIELIIFSTGLSIEEIDILYKKT